MTALFQNTVLWQTAPWAAAFAVLFWSMAKICGHLPQIIRQTRLLVREWRSEVKK